MHSVPRPLGFLVAFLAACSRREGTPDKNDAAGLEGAGQASSVTVASAPSSPRDAGVPSSRDAAPVHEASVERATDAGPSACRLVWGPAEQPFRGPAELAVTSSELRVVANQDGNPRVFPVPIVPPPRSPGAAPPAPESFIVARWPPCAVAGKWAFCPSKEGAITRTTLGASDTNRIAKSHGGTRIAAAALGEGHSVLAFLETHKTSEGDMLQAFALLDDGEPVRLSDDGAGANLVRLVPRGAGATAVYLDLRSGMLPVHARALHAKGKELALGPDAVLFVGGPPERGVELAVAEPPGTAYVLVPTAKETTEFGVATIPLGEPPKPDVGASWSLYPNGLDPAPIAAAGPFVARVRPRDASAGAARVVELGKLDGTGTFTSLGSIADAPRFGHLAIATDSYGAVWILYADPAHTWLERRVCP